MSLARAAPPWFQTHRRQQVLCDRSSSQANGLWPLAGCPARGLPGEGKGRPKSQPQTTNYRTPIWFDLFTLKKPPHKEGPGVRASSHPTPDPMSTALTAPPQELGFRKQVSPFSA